MARLKTHGVRSLAVPFLAAVALAACGASPGDTPAAPGSGAPPVSSASAVSTPGGPGLDAAAALLDAASLADADSLGALEGIRFTEAGTAAAAAAIAAGATGDALWAATYVYASAATDPAPLLAVAANASASVSIKAMAGAGLLAMGKREGFAPLIEALGSPAAMDGSEPRTTAWEFAADVLERSTRAGFPEPVTGDEAERAALAAQWATWLTTNAGHLRFDAATQLWVLA